MPNVPGNNPCTELDTRAGTWRYDANRLDQHFSPAERFATGLRNGEGISFDSAGRIFATQHGRDQLGQNWPKLYTLKQNANLPAEELVILRQGSDFGWPECYYDDGQKKLVLAPEYGGDGGKAVGVCSQKQAPVAAFPAHWAPNAMLIYEGSQFPSAYKDGAFIAFHGSGTEPRNRKGGYNVVFQPLADGKPSGPFVVFADGLRERSSSRARRRIARLGWRSGLTVHSISPTIRAAGFGASPSRVGTRRPELRPPRLHLLPRRRRHPATPCRRRASIRTPVRGHSRYRRARHRTRSPWANAFLKDRPPGGHGAGCHGTDGKGHGHGLRFDERQVALGQWQRPGDYPDDRPRRTKAQGAHRR